ncbi:hypothetical protein TNCV_2554351 [Trichonephila clavipes]|nr:hypothetical protein TNCV_2554351 [Trichonephila clavipes]
MPLPFPYGYWLLVWDTVGPLVMTNGKILQRTQLKKGKRIREFRENPSQTKISKSWLDIYANLQSPKTPKSIRDQVPYRSVTT